jgi:phosphatidate cytidylyltransferase
MGSNMLKRVAFAAVAIPAAIGIVWQGGLLLAALVAVVGVLGLREIYRFARQAGLRPLGGIGFPAAIVVPFAVWAAVGPETLDPTLIFTVAPIGLLLLMTAALASRRPAQHPLGSVAVTAMGVAYTVVLPSFLLVIRHAGSWGERSWVGVWATFFPLVIVWSCDTAAMFAGKLIGGAKIAPVVSPGKTWAGTIAGVLVPIGIAPGYYALALRPYGVQLELWQVIVIAAVLSIVGQVGDLVESLFKREAGFKDSSDIIPGHGGVLDRFDSLYFVLPAAAALYRLFGLL